MSMFKKAFDFMNSYKPSDWPEYYFEQSKLIAKALHPFGIPLLEEEKKLSRFFDTTKTPDIFDSRKFIPIILPKISELLDSYTLVIEGGLAIGATAQIIELPNDKTASERLHKESARIITDEINESFKRCEVNNEQARAFKKQWDIKGEGWKHSQSYKVVQILLERHSEYNPEDYVSNVFESPEVLAVKNSNFYYSLSYFYDDTFTNLSDKQIQYYRKIYANYINVHFSDLSDAEKEEYSEMIFNGKLIINKSKKLKSTNGISV